MNKCAFGVHLYVAIEPLSAAISVLFSFLDLYHEDASTSSSIYFYNEAMVLVFSSYAVYCLVLFYHIAAGDLAAVSRKPGRGGAQACKPAGPGALAAAWLDAAGTSCRVDQASLCHSGPPP